MDIAKQVCCTPVSILLILCCSTASSKSEDQLTQAKPLSPGDILVSAGGDFALGFFSPTNSSNNLYIGIWYHNLPEPERTVVWVANRGTPVTTASSAQLAITNSSSQLVLSDTKKGLTVWTTNATAAAGGAVTAVLLDSGNFVLRRASDGTVVWQSFDHPTDTTLPTMKLSLRYKTHTPRFFAWKGPRDPSAGDISYGVDPDRSNLQFFIWNGTVPYCRTAVATDSSQLTSSTSSAYQTDNTTYILYQETFNTVDEFYYTYRVSDGSPYMRLVLEYTGKLKLLSWNSRTSSWDVVFQRPSSGCEFYGSCGQFSYCDHTVGVPSCQCLDGFELVDSANSSRGCQRKEALKCGKKTDIFVTLPGMKVPDRFLRVRNMRSSDQCAAECSRNCSCTAYAYANSSTPTCLLWTGDLLDTGKVGFGSDLYLRLANSSAQKKSNSTKILLPIASCVLLVALVAIVWTCKYRAIQQKKKARKRMMLEYLRTADEAEDNNVEFPFISFEDIAAATYNFSDSNLLGRGGFGKVYKGLLGGVKEVAVKRLSKGSGQGVQEFKNEVVLISKLQHKNLVKLLGCCIHEDEKMLVYEYLPNKSLDYFLFDPARKSMLQWPTRFKIIQGIARGIMYLHHDSRLTIIHRDLKASNILLDTEMSPKISDFGMARIFCSDLLEENTNRVVGTYGYMPREYAMEGKFSVKSDTYSFGVLLLEIVSGIKISSSSHLIRDFPNLIVYAWNLWKDGKAEDLVDPAVKNNFPLDDEVSRCICVGLLCVQDSPDCRPLMSDVVVMLENKTTPLPVPLQPVYFARRNAEPQPASNTVVSSSVNDMSHTTLDGR